MADGGASATKETDIGVDSSVPKTDAKHNFKRNFFINTADTTGAIPARPEGRRLRRKEDPPQPQSEWVKFSEDTRAGMTTFLDNFVTNAHDLSKKADGMDILKVQPHAVAMMEILGVTKEPIDDEALKLKIGKVLDTPQGWVLAKTLLDQQTAMQVFALGLMTSAELKHEKALNPKDLLVDSRGRSAGEKGKHRVRRFVEKNSRKVDAVMGGIAGASVGYLATEAVQAGVLGKSGRAAVEAAKFLAHHVPTDKAPLIALAGGVTGAVMGYHFGTESDGGVDGSDAGFKVARDALQSIKRDEKYVKYIKEVIGVDVNDYVINEGSRTINVIDNPKSTNNISDILRGAVSNMETRGQYFDALGIPPEDRDVMPELFISKNAPAGFEHTGERVTADITRRYHELSGDAEKPKEEPNIDNFIKDEYGQGPESPWYCIADGKEMPALPPFDIDNLVPGLDRAGNSLPDLWNQPITLPDGAPNPFYGRIDGRRMDITLPDGSVSRENVMSMIARGPDVANIKVMHGAIDKFGQSEGEPGFGRESVDHIDEEKIQIRPGAQDKLGQDEGTIYYGTGIDGDSVPLPEPNPLMLPDGVGEPDIWGQESGSKFYGRMDERLANRDAMLTDVDVNQRTFRPSEGATDRWGQQSTYPGKKNIPNPYFGRTDGRGLIPQPPDIAEFNELVPFDMMNFAGSEVVDIWGQSQSNPDGSANIYFGKVDGSSIPDRSFMNFPEDQLVDTFGQSYFMPDGVTRNPFFARAEESSIAPFDLNNIDSEYKVDIWGQPALDPEGNRNPFFGVMDRGDIVGTIPDFNAKNFDLQDLVDNQGRDYKNPLFGRGEYTEKVVKKRRIRKDREDDVDIDIPSAWALETRDTAGFSNLEAEFWTDDRPIPDLDIDLLNPVTGLDSRGRAPSHPLFCRDVDSRIPDVAGLSRDKWGQEIGSESFGVSDGSIPETLNGEINLELYRKARELVLADLTEDLIKKLGETPKRTVTVIETKITERTAEDGRIIKEKREKAAKDGPEYQKLLDESIRPRIDAITEYEDAKKELEDARKDLPKYITDTLGTGITTVEEAKQAIREARRGTSPLMVTVEGREVSIERIEERRRKAREDYQDRVVETLREHPREDEEPLELYKDRLKTLDVSSKEQLNADLAEIKEDSDLLDKVEKKLNDFQETIKTKEKVLDAKGEVAQVRRDTLYGPRASEREKSMKLLENADLQEMLLKSSPSEILKKINELHGLDASIGWEAADNEDEANDEILAYAVVTAKAIHDNKDAIDNFADNPTLKQIVDAGVAFDQVENLSVSELEARLTGVLNEAQITQAKEDIEAFAYTMTRAIKSMDEDLSLRIRRAGRAAEAIDLKDEVATLEVAKQLMERQGEIFGITADVVSEVTKRFPLKGEKMEMFSELSDLDKKEYTKAEKDVAGDPPVAYFEILNTLFDYQGKADREDRFKKISKELGPDKLYAILKDVTSEPVSRGADLGGLLYILQDNIKRGLVTRRALRGMFEGIIDRFEATALAMP